MYLLKTFQTQKNPRTILLMLLVVCLNGTVLLEQPANSILEYYPRFRDWIQLMLNSGGKMAVSWQFFWGDIPHQHSYHPPAWQDTAWSHSGQNTWAYLSFSWMVGGGLHIHGRGEHVNETVRVPVFSCWLGLGSSCHMVDGLIRGSNSQAPFGVLQLEGHPPFGSWGTQGMVKKDSFWRSSGGSTSQNRAEIYR